MSDIVEEMTGATPEPEAVQEQPQEPVETKPEEVPEQPVAEEAPQEELTPEPEKEEPQAIPYSVFKSTREDLKATIAALQAENEAMKQQPKPEPQKVPDMYEDPEGFQAFMAKQLQNTRMSTLMDVSEAMAVQQHGQDVVDAAFAAVKASGQGARFLESKNPYGDMVAWHKQQQVLQEIGDDPEAYRQKIEAEIRQKIDAELAAKQAEAMAKAAPPSMAKVNGAGGATQPGWTGPTPIGDILG